MKKVVKRAAVAKVLVLRTCAADMTSYGGFQWPEKGRVEAADWAPAAECGKGLHGWLWGEGDHSAASWEPGRKWLVVEVLAKDVVNLRGKVKFSEGVVVHCGDQESATSYLAAKAPGRGIIGGTSTSGYGGTSTSGYGGKSTSGADGKSTSGADGIIQFEWWDGARKRVRTYYVGEGGIEPNVAYKLDADHEPVKA